MKNKKHLLYIHDDRFRAELRKSALVNDLLAVYYDGTGKGSTKPSADGSTKDSSYYCPHGYLRNKCPKGCSK